jgi:hypothetical protein
MATTNLELKVDVTAALHDALVNLARKYHHDYGVKIDSISFDWVDGIVNSQLVQVSINSSKRS